jgi:signal transduction histidine kinase
MIVSHPLPATLDHDEELIRQLFKAHLAMRVVLFVFVAVSGYVAVADGKAALPIAVAVGGIGAWTAFTGWWYVQRRSRRALVIVDNIVTLAALVVFTMLGQSEGLAALPRVWAIAPPLAAAICGGPLVGFAMGSALACVTIAAQPIIHTDSWTLPFGMAMAPWALGFLVEQVRRSAAERDRLAASASVLAERQRLARVIHDGALQVLALVEREAGSLGPRGARLAHEAREQERALRRVLADKEVPWDGPSPSTTEIDLAVLLDDHASERVTVSAMADGVMVDKGVAAEIDAATTEVLTNVTKHAGPDAWVWILLETVGSEIIVSIRDNGIGTDPMTLNTADAHGRMGVKQSIRGRIVDLGGVATVRTAPGRGVEWEFRIPAAQ